MVSIAAFQAVDPGSIPGRRRPFSCLVGRKKMRGPGIEPGFLPSQPSFRVRFPADADTFFFFLKKKNAVTRIRTWVTAATTQGPNH